MEIYLENCPIELFLSSFIEKPLGSSVFCSEVMLIEVILKFYD